PFVLRPFSETEVRAALESDRPRMRAFNRLLSSVRIVSEHTFGRLKGRFPSLKDLGPHVDLEDLYDVLEALIILHNICIDWDDRPENIWSFDPDDPPRSNEEMPPDVDGDMYNICANITGGSRVPLYETDAWLKEEGYRKRWAILNELFP
ncbi:hypothetical protein DICSQDRAFT_59386, partial [Dichomitus squalens LYAD-421 SS1]